MKQFEVDVMKTWAVSETVVIQAESQQDAIREIRRLYETWDVLTPSLKVNGITEIAIMNIEERR